MIRKDGEFTFYIIKFRSEGGSWRRLNLDNHYVRTEEYEEFSASGRTWQEIGEHGTYNQDVAIKACAQLQEKYPNLKLAAFEVKITQNQTMLKTEDDERRQRLERIENETRLNVQHDMTSATWINREVIINDQDFEFLLELAKSAIAQKGEEKPLDGKTPD